MEPKIENGFDMNRILKNKKIVFMSTEESLRDVVPIKWSKDVLSGKKKVELASPKEE